MSANDINLPQAPNDLCFTVEDFLKADFDVDTFLQDHRKVVKLETMRDDLGIYLKLLRSAMIDLINRDYVDFVNLSSNIIDLDKVINDLETPLGQLKEEVMHIRQALEDDITEITANLSIGAEIRKRKLCLYSLTGVHKCLGKLSCILPMRNTQTRIENLNIDILEQAAIELNQLKFHMFRCKSYISETHEKDYMGFNEILMDHLNELFISCVNENDSNLLVRCLRVYIMLNKISEAEDLIRRKIVHPSISNIINEGTSRTDLLGLQNLYQKFLDILHLELQQLLDVTSISARTPVKGFNFLVNSFWIEVAGRIDTDLKFIYAPGNPDLFHKRYQETLEFLSKLENGCDTPMISMALKSHPGYQNFLKKWNLSVYYQIRFQEIAGTVEETLTSSISSNAIIGTKDLILSNNLTLRASNVIWDCLLKIWSEKIFLSQLFSQFWKLSLQLFSRYKIWVESVLKQVWPEETNNENKLQYPAKLDLLIHLCMDVDKFIMKIPSFSILVESRYKCNDATLHELLQECLQETTKQMENILPLITVHIVEELLNPCIIHLKQVSDIPRLFRRTKRDVPTKSCSYIKNAFHYINLFHTDYHTIVPKYINHWLQLALSSLTKQ